MFMNESTNEYDNLSWNKRDARSSSAKIFAILVSSADDTNIFKSIEKIIGAMQFNNNLSTSHVELY
jgi:hypothetical protein